MSLLRNMKRGEKRDHGYAVEVQAGDEMLDVSALGRVTRKLIDKDINKLVDRHGSLAHPVTGERPIILFHMSKRGASDGTMRLKTDSPELRAHLASRGLAVLGEVIVEPPAPAEAAAQQGA